MQLVITNILSGLPTISRCLICRSRSLLKSLPEKVVYFILKIALNNRLLYLYIFSGMFLIQLEFLHKDDTVVDSHSRSVRKLVLKLSIIVLLLVNCSITWPLHITLLGYGRVIYDKIPTYL